MGKFADKVAKKIEGGDAASIGAKVESKVRVLLTTQVSLLNNSKVDLELKKSDAEDNLENVLYPTTIPVDGESYLYAVKNAKERLESIEEQIKETEESIAFYQSQIENLF